MSNPSDMVVFIGKQDRTLPDLIRGEVVDTMGSSLIYNVTESSIEDLVVDVTLNGTTTSTAVSDLPALVFLKAPFMIKGDITESDETIDIEMTIRQGDSILDREIVPLRVRNSTSLPRATRFRARHRRCRYCARSTRQWRVGNTSGNRTVASWRIGRGPTPGVLLRAA